METPNSRKINHPLPTKTRDGNQKSLWENETRQINVSGESFDTEQVVDALVVGGGITGITTALLLQRQGKNCILAEAHSIGFGTTGGTTAHINTFADTTYAEVEKAFGEKEAALFAKGISDAVAQIREFVNVYKIDCDLDTKKRKKSSMSFFSVHKKPGLK
jgi:glycine/D-amino acid oxidase-like deaminating enzyme